MFHTTMANRQNIPVLEDENITTEMLAFFLYQTHGEKGYVLHQKRRCKSIVFAIQDKQSNIIFNNQNGIYLNTSHTQKARQSVGLLMIIIN